MHEMSLCRALLDVVRHSPAYTSCTKIKTICIQAGALTAIEMDALRFCFLEASKGTKIEGASLIVEYQQGQIYCHDCRQTAAYPRYFQACLNCGGYKLDIIAGEGLVLKSMEVE